MEIVKSSGDLPVDVGLFADYNIVKDKWALNPGVIENQFAKMAASKIDSAFESSLTEIQGG
jgi:hypothetical protein